MNITFRPATRLDLDDLTNLSLGVHNIHLQQKPEEFKKISEQNIANFFRDILLDENIILMICHYGKVAAGYIMIRLVERQENPIQKGLRFAYIDQISVKKEYRQQGIGKKMIQEIIRLIKDKGFSIMRLDVWAFNREARQFFRSVGFKPLVERMEMKLR